MPLNMLRHRSFSVSPSVHYGGLTPLLGGVESSETSRLATRTTDLFLEGMCLGAKPLRTLKTASFFRTLTFREAYVCEYETRGNVVD